MDFKDNIETFTLVFLDLETTGLDFATGDAICEIGALKVKNREVIAQFQTLVNPKKDMPAQAYAIHKISNADVKGAPYFEEVAVKLKEFISDSVLCIYNAEFDIGFLNYYLRKFNLGTIDPPAIDILAMARKTLRMPKYNLTAIASFFNISCQEGMHRALKDASVASHVFFKLMDMIKTKNISRLQDLIGVYGYEGEASRVKTAQKTLMLKETINRRLYIRIRYFSKQGTIEEAKVKPIHIVEEKRNLYLWCQFSENIEEQIPLNHVLNVEIIL